MQLSPALSFYIARRFLAVLALVFAVVTAVVFLVDIVNLNQRTSSRPSVDFGMVLEMALLRLPFLSQTVLPFVVLFGTMLTYFSLMRSNELIVTRAAGVSAWQVLLPSLAVSVVLGAVAVTVVGPLSSALAARFEQMESRYLRGQQSQLAVSSAGLWLREQDGDRQSIVHAARVGSSGAELSAAVFFAFDKDDRFLERIDAATAVLRVGHWELHDALITRPDAPSRRIAHMMVPTRLSLELIQDSFASPRTLSVWALPRFIEFMERMGFSVLGHRIQWHSLLAVPLLLAAMVLVATAFSLRLRHRGRLGLFLAAGLACGFALYFAADVARALGMSGSVPAPLAAWAPAASFAMFGVALMFHLEDG